MQFQNSALRSRFASSNSGHYPRPPGFFYVYDQWEAQLLAMVRLKARVGLYSDIPADEVCRAHLNLRLTLGRA